MCDNSESKTNDRLITCQHCPSKILRPGLGTFTNTEFELPLMSPKSAEEVNKTERLNEFWSVSDKFHFENIAFSRDVGSVKYLACSDCDVGPIGYHCKESGLSYISLDRVRHSDHP